MKATQNEILEYALIRGMIKGLKESVENLTGLAEKYQNDLDEKFTEELNG